MYEQFISDRAKRRARGQDIGFQTVIRSATSMQQFVLSSKDVGKGLKSMGKGIKTVYNSSKTLTQKGYSMAKSGLDSQGALKLFSPSKGNGLEVGRTREDSKGPEGDFTLRSSHSSRTSLDGPDFDFGSSHSSLSVSSVKDMTTLHQEAAEALQQVDEVLRRMELESHKNSAVKQEPFPDVGSNSLLIDFGGGDESSSVPRRPSTVEGSGFSTPQAARERDITLTFSPVPSLYSTTSPFGSSPASGHRRSSSQTYKTQPEGQSWASSSSPNLFNGSVAGTASAPSSKSNTPAPAGGHPQYHRSLDADNHSSPSVNQQHARRTSGPNSVPTTPVPVFHHTMSSRTNLYPTSLSSSSSPVVPSSSSSSSTFSVHLPIKHAGSASSVGTSTPTSGSSSSSSQPPLLPPPPRGSSASPSVGRAPSSPAPNYYVNTSSLQNGTGAKTTTGGAKDAKKSQDMFSDLLGGFK